MAGDGGGGARRDRSGRRRGGGPDCRHRLVRADARHRSPGWRGKLLAPAVIWPDQRSAAQVAEITGLVGAERLHGSPAARRYRVPGGHGPLVSTGRAGTVAPGADDSDAQGLFALAAHGRVRHGPQRRRRHAPAGRGPPRLVGRPARPVGHSAGPTAAGAAVGAGGRGIGGGRGCRPGSDIRHPGRHRRGGHGVQRPGRRHGGRRPSSADPEHGRPAPPACGQRPGGSSRAVSTPSAAGWSRRRGRRAGTRWGRCWRPAWRCAGCATRCLAGATQAPIRG